MQEFAIRKKQTRGKINIKWHGVFFAHYIEAETFNSAIAFLSFSFFYRELRKMLHNNKILSIQQGRNTEIPFTINRNFLVDNERGFFLANQQNIYHTGKGQDLYCCIAKMLLKCMHWLNSRCYYKENVHYHEMA